MRACYVTAASENYIKGLTAQFNSLEQIGNKHDVLLLSHNLPEAFLKSLKKYSFKIRPFSTGNEKNQVHGTAIKRFYLAYKYGCEYDAVCLLDADMFFLSNPETFFTAADCGMIVVGSNGMLVGFNRDYQKRYNLDLGTDNFVYTKVHTTAPIFLNKKDLDWFEALYNAKRIDHWDDFLYLNLLGIHLGKHERIIAMPPYMFTGIHHFGLKPNTRWINKGGLILSETEEQVYICHGKWWDIGWTRDLMPTMERYFKDNQYSELHHRRAKQSMDLMMNKFDSLLNM